MNYANQKPNQVEDDEAAEGEGQLKRQPPGFLPPNSCDETQGPGVRSQQDYKK